VTLDELQEAFVLDVTRRTDGNAALAGKVSFAAGVHAEIRLDIYRDNVIGAHRGALDVAFPVVREVLGDRYWEQLLIAEIPTYGTRSPDLHSYGAFMPELLTTLIHERKELSNYRYLAELARLEWIVHETQFCADEPVFDWLAFKAISPASQGNLILVTSKTLTLFDSEYAVDGVWHAHQLTESYPLPPAPDGIQCCISRGRAFDVRVARVSAQEATMLKAIQRGSSLDELRAGTECETDVIVQQLFAWIKHGYVVGFSGISRV
jgi:hypothetical protein